jgi:hypothetical protein
MSGYNMQSAIMTTTEEPFDPTKYPDIKPTVVWKI